MRTLLLDAVAWDLVVDAKKDIAVADDPYASAQDAASAIKLFAGELYYNTTRGVPYFTQILGFAPPLSYMKAKFQGAALEVPDVATAVCFISSIVGREVKGQVQITDSSGQSATVAF